MNIEFLATVAVIAPDPPASASCTSTRSGCRSRATAATITTASR